MSADVEIRNEGSLVTFRPVTWAGRAWIDEHVTSEEWQWLGSALCVETRYAGDIIEGMTNEGLEVEEL